MKNPNREAAIAFLQDIQTTHGIYGALQFLAAAMDDVLPVDPSSKRSLTVQAESSGGRVSLVLMFDPSKE